MKWMKKCLAMLLVAAMLLTFAGCGDDGKAELTGEVIDVVVQTNGLGEAWISDAATAFRNETGIQVNVNFDAFAIGNMNTVLTTESVDAADIYFGQTFEWVEWLSNDLIVDLSDVMNDTSSGKSLNERCLTQDYYILDEDGNKKQGIVPLTLGPLGIAYNKEMMNYLCHDVLGWEDGHDYPTTTKELEEVFAALETVQKNGTNDALFTYQSGGKSVDVEPLAWSGTVGTLEFLFKAWIQQYWGPDYLEQFYAQQDNGNMFNDEGFYICYQKIVDLLQLEENESGIVVSGSSIPNCLSYNHEESQMQFLLGHSLMIPSGSWLYSEMETVITDVENWGFMPVPVMTDDNGVPITKEGVEMPKNADGSYAAYMDINTQDFLCIPTKSDKVDLAKKFIAYIFSEEYLPTLKEALQAPVCFSCNDEDVEFNAWAKNVQSVVDVSTLGRNYTSNPMFGIGALNFCGDGLPYARLSQGGYGSITKLYDVSTGEVVTDASLAKGFVVTENVYKYVQSNYNYRLQHWNEYRQRLGLI